MTETVTEDFQGSLYSKVLGSGCARDSIELYRRKQEVPYTVSYQQKKTVSDSVYAMENLEKKDKYQVFLNGNHPELTICSENKNGKHLLIFKDSFANAWIPFAVNDFESIHVIDQMCIRDSWMSASVWVSTLLVASSRIRISGSEASALAIVRSCRSP